MATLTELFQSYFPSWCAFLEKWCIKIKLLLFSIVLYQLLNCYFTYIVWWIIMTIKWHQVKSTNLSYFGCLKCSLCNKTLKCSLRDSVKYFQILYVKHKWTSNFCLNSSFGITNKYNQILKTINKATETFQWAKSFSLQAWQPELVVERESKLWRLSSDLQIGTNAALAQTYTQS